MINKKENLIFYTELLLVAILCVISFVVYTLLSNGGFSSSLFFRGGEDIFMAFFNSIRDDAGFDTFSKYKTIYPPLVALFFMLLSKFILSYFIQQSTDKYLMRTVPMAYIFLFVFFAICLLIIWFCIQKKCKSKPLIERIFYFLLIICSYPMLYAFERGNIILLSIVLICFFVTFYKDDNKCLHNLSLFALALSITIKIYPVFFALIIIKNKDIISLVKTGVMTVILFFVPFVFYDGIGGLVTLFNNIFSFSSERESTAFVLNIGLWINTFVTLDNSTMTTINIICILLFSVLALFSKERYIQSICCYLALCSFSGAASTYTIGFILPALLLLLFEEKKNIKQLIYLPIILLIVTIFGFYYSFTDNTYRFENMYIYYSLVLVCLVLIEAGFVIFKFIKGKKQCYQ